MKVCVLASGSKGNSTYIEIENHKILIDIGITYKDLETRLSEININPKDIDTVLITHAHSDHIKGLGVFNNKVKPNIYMSNKTYEELNDKIKDQINDYITITSKFNIDNIIINTLSISHDVDCHGYIIEEQNKSVVYITDTGYLNQKYYEILKDRNIYIFESNHDPEMNMHSKKPKHLRDRVISDRGHLSNKQASDCLSKIVDKDTSYILLAHLSEDDNDPLLALNTLEETLTKNQKKVLYIKTAKQKEISDFIEI